jgi:hypothetical protein
MNLTHHDDAVIVYLNLEVDRHPRPNKPVQKLCDLRKATVQSKLIVFFKQPNQSSPQIVNPVQSNIQIIYCMPCMRACLFVQTRQLNQASTNSSFTPGND